MSSGQEQALINSTLSFLAKSDKVVDACEKLSRPNTSTVTKLCICYDGRHRILKPYLSLSTKTKNVIMAWCTRSADQLVLGHVRICSMMRNA